MYVDLGKRRGRVRFTWRELVAIWGLFTFGVGYVIHSEVVLAQVREQLAACQQSVEQLKSRQASTYSLQAKGGE